MKAIGRFLLQVAALALLIMVSCKVGYGQTVITTGPITINDNVEWSVPNTTATTTAQAMALVMRVRDNDPNATAFVPFNATSCATAGIDVNFGLPAGGFICTAKVNTALMTIVNARGVHNLFGRLFDPAANVEGAALAPFALTTAADAPGFRLRRPSNP